MLDHPFANLRPYAHQLEVKLLTKKDNVRGDADIAKALGAKDLASLRQMHGNAVVRVHEPTSRTLEADGMATDRRHLTLTVRSADCQNFVIYAPVQHIAGVLHVGWKGLNAKAITAFYAFIEKTWGIEPTHTYVGAGPSLCKKCAEFTDPARELPGVPPSLIDGRLADLIGAADAEFDAVGVPAKHRERINACTKCHHDTYWSYRGGDREAVTEGWTNVLAVTLL